MRVIGGMLCALLGWQQVGWAVIHVEPNDDLISIANSAEPGELLIVTPGVYAGGAIENPVVIRCDASAGEAIFASPVTVRAAGVVLDGLTWSDLNGTLLQIRAPDVTIRGCQFRNFGLTAGSTAKAIWIREDDFYHRTLVEDSLFEQWGNAAAHSSCIKVSQSGGAQHMGTVLRNNIFRLGSAGGNNVAIQLFCPTLVEGNEIYGVEDAVEVKGDGCTIRGNHLHDNVGYEQLSNRSGSHTLFEANVVSDNVGPMAWVAEGDDIVFANNLFYRNGAGLRLTGVVPGRYAQSSRVQITNNVFYGNQTHLSTDSRQTIPPADVVLWNNIFVGGNIRVPAKVIGEADYNLYYETNRVRAGAHDILSRDPGFVDAEAGDFRPVPTSPLVNAGRRLQENGTDATGGRRDDRWDIGPLEFRRIPRQ